eukprot:515628_1
MVKTSKLQNLVWWFIQFMISVGLIIYIFYNSLVMNHTRKVYDQLYDTNGQLNTNNRDILYTFINYGMQTNIAFDAVAHKLYGNIDNIPSDVQDALRQLITINHDHIEIGFNILHIFNNEEELRARYDDESLETELELYFENVDDIVELIELFTTTRYKKFQLNLLDGGGGVTVHEGMVRMLHLIWAIISRAEIVERVHNAGGHSSFNPAEQCVGGIKEQTRIQCPVVASHGVGFNDINNTDIVNINIKDYDESQILFLKIEARKISEFFSALLNGNPESKTYIKSRVMNYEQNEKSKDFPYLYPNNLIAVIKNSSDKKDAMYAWNVKMGCIDDSHSVLWNTSYFGLRYGTDMSSSHWINPNAVCPLEHKSDEAEEYIQMGICKAPEPGNWRLLNDEKHTNHPVFDYLPVTTDSMTHEDILIKDDNIPSVILSKYIADKFMYLMETVRPLFFNVPWSCPMRNKDVVLPENVEQFIQTELKAKGLKPNIVKQDLNKYITSKTAYSKYIGILLKDGKSILMKNSQLIWNLQDPITQGVITDQLQPVINQIHSVTINVKNETIIRLMQERIQYIEKDKQLKKKFDIARFQDTVNQLNDLNIEDNDGFVENETDSNPEDSNSEQDEESDIESEATIEESIESGDGKICKICDSAKPPPHKVNEAVTGIWLSCEKNGCLIHWECCQTWAGLVPPSKSVRCCGAC